MHLEGVQYVLDGLWSVYFTLFYRSVPGIYRSYRCNSGVSIGTGQCDDGALWCFDMHLEEYIMFYWLWSVVSIGLYRYLVGLSGVIAVLVLHTGRCALVAVKGRSEVLSTCLVGVLLSLVWVYTSWRRFAIGLLSVCLVGMAAMSVGGYNIGSYTVTTCLYSYHTCNDCLEWLSGAVVCLLILLTCC